MKKLYFVSCLFNGEKLNPQKALCYLEYVLACSFLLFGSSAGAQSLSTVNANAQTVSQILAGSGVTITNYTLSGAATASGTFTYTGSNLGMTGGTILTTGKVQDVNQSATNTASKNHTGSGDTQLSTLTSGTIYDPIILEFDLVPQGPLLRFDYVFASEEYPEGVCSANSDVFGIFITGANPSGGNYTNQNLALVPGTSKPVGINSVNPGSIGSGAGGGTCSGANESLSYSSYYTNNLSPTDAVIAFDGMTKVMNVSVAVTPCSTYHFKIAIADVNNRINDSGLFLSAYSFTTTPVSVSAVSQLDYAGFSSAYEGCVGGTFTLGLSQAQVVDVYVNLSITGTATNGTDYTTIPGTVIIPAGQTSVTIDVDPISDGISESAETVTVAPLNPCTGTASSSATITIRDDIPASITVADSTLCAGQSTQLTASGGLAYTWSPATGLSNSAISNPTATPATTTTYTSSMSWGACTKTATATLHVSTPSLSTSASPAGTICNGGTVAITATSSSGVSPYSYLWSTGGITPAVTVATGGTYTVTSTDSYGCTANSSKSVTISNLSISGTATNVSCVGGNNGAVDVTVTGSNAPFTYNWGGGVTSQDRTNLVTGTYTVTASNTVGCSVTASYSVTQPVSALTTSATISNVSCNGGNNGSINLIANGGVSPYSYLWSTGATSQDLNNVVSGSYSVTVTDFNGCTASRISTITQPTAISTSQTHVNENCFGQSIGSIDLTVSGGTGAYSYIWSNAATSQDISSLTSGTYIVTVSDANSCTATRSVTITEPAVVSPTLGASNPSCFGGSNGSITTSTSGGTSPYTYNWGGGITTQNRTSVAAGTYNITVTDNNSCTGSTSIILSEPTTLSLSATETNVSCNGGSNGSITLSVSGGTSPYTYNWGGGITTQNRTGLAIGTYSVTVTDNNACTSSVSGAVIQPTALSISRTSTNISCNGGSDGSIDITVSGGTSPCTYNWGGGGTTQDRSSLSSGTYNVTATDAAGCTVSNSTTITQPTALSFSESHVNATCNGGGDGSINVTISGGTSPYTYDWSGGITTQNRTSLAAGTYSVTSTDDNGCSITGSAAISQPTVISISQTVTDATCAPGNNGAITLSVSGGSSPYFYNWGGGITTQNRTSLFAGAYTVTVTDNISCTAAKTIAVSQVGTGMSLSSSVTNVSCNAGSNGAIDITLTGGSAPITYNWGGGITTQDRTSLIAGNYSLTVTDGLGCSAISTNTITEPTALSAVVNTTDILCFGANTGSIIITVGGGTSGYTYNWGGGVTSQNRTNIAAGSYTVTVTDATSCTATSTSVITQPVSVFSLSTTVSNVSCYGGSNGSITLSVSGGTSGYTFNWSTGSISQNQSNIASGTYNVSVTDANSCTASVSSVVAQPSAALFVSLTTTNLSCNSVNTGAITSTATGGTTSYSFIWDDAITTQNRSSLSAGSYSVTVTDNNSCSSSASATLTEPTAIQVLATSTDITCNGLSNGTITLSTTGGVSPYSYNWGGGITSQNRASLAVGTYIVTITDANSCTATSSTIIAEPSVLTLTINSGASICLSATGTANAVTNSTGTPPYSYTWSNGTTAQNLTGLSPGSFSVTVTDNNGCSISNSSVIGLSGNNTDASFSVSGSYCGPNAVLNFTHTGSGTITSHYWDFGNSLGTSTQNNPSYTYPSAGGFIATHIVYRGFCSDTVTSPLTIYQKPTLTSVNANITCNGLNNGTIDLSVTGSPAFTYNWGGGITTQNRNSLSTGTYTVTVTDANMCTSTLSATISQPNVLTVTNTNTNVSCNGGSNGAINLTVVGGTTPFAYNWSGGITSQNRSSLSGGTYNVTVTDANSCSSVNAISVYQPNALSLTTAATNVSCFGQNNGAISLTVTGGTGAYTYNWGGGVTSQNRTSLAATTYNVTVTDANSCSASTSATITQPSALTTTISASNVSCLGGNNGSITSSISGGTSPFTYTWNDANTNSNRSNLSSGTYSVTILDQNSCSVSASANVTQPSMAVSITVNGTSAISCYGDSTGTISITTSGGVPGYIYLWSDSKTFEDRTNMLGGTYFVSATDVNGCSAATSATISQPSGPLAIDTIVAVNVLCTGASTGSLIPTISGGTIPYSYNWGGGVITGNRTNVPAGTYSLTVTDFKGCTATAIATITQPVAALSVSTSVTNVACYGNSTGAINLTVTGGTTAYLYNWGGGVATQNRTNIPAGAYNVTVTDANACSISLSRTVTQPLAALSTSTSVTNVACYGNSTGAINLTVTGGTTVYSYNWGGGITAQNRTNIPAGTYNVTITDANACSTSASATITQPSAVLNVSASVTNVTCFGNSTGAISLTVTGGTTSYSYNWGGGVTTQNRTNIPAGTYNVTVTDANACSTSTSATVAQPTAALSVSASVTNVACFGNSTGAISLTVSGGTTAYSYNWGGGITTQNRTNIPSGAYNVTVTDGNACSTSTSRTVTQPASALGASATTINVACFGNLTGAINLVVTGGTFAYSYNWGGGITTQNRTNIPAGNYDVTITDANACSTSLGKTITQPAAPLTVIPSVIVVTCFGSSTGTINLNVSGGTTPYSYYWNDGITTQNRTGIPAGIYNVTVTDANICSLSNTSVVTQPLAGLNISVSSTNVTCYGNSTGAINLTVTGGTGIYLYNWNDAAISQDRTNLTAGTYSVTITDLLACSTFASVTITQPSAPLSASTSVINVACFGNSTGAINLTATGGTTSYSYNWGGGVTTQNRTGISSGTYNVTVTDANACSASTSAVVLQPGAALNALASVTNVACFGNSTGAISLTVSGGTTAYLYNWGGGITTQNRTNIPSGTYNVTVADANGCSTSASATVTQPTAVLNVSAAVTNVACYGNSTGAINLTVSGGTTAYSYNWSGGITTQNRINIPAGTYDVTITDANACSISLTQSVTQPSAPLNISAVVINVDCFGNSSGAVNLTVAGGTSAYTYDWGGGITTQNRTNIPIGTYDVTVTDANACSASSSSTITEPAVFSIAATSTGATCNGAWDGTIDVTVSGATVPYTYLWSNGSTSQDLNNAPAGNYSVTVQDANACATTTSATITQPMSLSVSETHTGVSCNGGTNGSITITLNGGTAPYAFVWNDSVTTQNRTNLPAGTYQLLVNDLNSCAVSQPIVITEPAVISISLSEINVSCNGFNNGSVASAITGGTPNYTLLWSTGAGSQNITALSPGNYNLTVVDINSCSATQSAVITEPTALNATATKTDVACYGGNTGSIDVTVTGGTTAYTYNWNSGGSTEDIQNIIAGTYIVTVTDANSCSVSVSTVIAEPVSPLTGSTLVTNVACYGNSTGGITLNVSGGTSAYSFNWGGGITTQNRINIPSGTYNVTVTDANACSASTSATVVQPAAVLSVSTSVTNVACYGNSTGAINLTVTGGTTAYSYNWGGITTQNRTGIPSGTYNVTVTDANACSISTSATVTQPASPLTVSPSITHVACFGNSTGSIILTVTGGTSSYIYNWGGGIATQNRLNIPAGNYTVTVTDANSCSASLSAAITQPVALVVNYTTTNPLCNGALNGSIDLTATGGVSPMTYLWNSSDTSEDRQNISAGVHTVTVTDNNGCQAPVSVTLTAPAAIILTETHSDASCFGSTDGNINLTVSGGTPSYNYTWSNGSAIQDISSLAAGSYRVTVTDNNGCTASLNSISITEPVQLTVALTTLDVACAGDFTGKINTSSSGGTAPYQFNWSNGMDNSSLVNMAAGTYALTMHDAHNCSATSAATINTLPQMDITGVAGELACEEATGGIDISMNQGSGPFTYRWSNGSTSEDLNNVHPGTYQVIVNDVNGCSLATTFEVVNLNSFSVNAGEDTIVTLGQFIELSATSTGSSQTVYTWASAFGLSCTDCAATSVQPRQSNVYRVVATDINGCSAEDEISVEVNEDHGLFIPNAFTPNGDGKNDLFQLYGNIAGIHIFNVKVFNRSGEKVFESSDASFTWDGMYKGELLPPSVCIYVVNAVFLDTYSTKTISGGITILR